MQVKVARLVERALRSPRVDLWRLSCALLALGALVDVAVVLPGVVGLTSPDALTIPRIGTLRPSLLVVAVLALAWVIGAVAFVFPSRLAGWGMLLPVSVAGFVGLDHQISGGHLYLLVIFSTLLLAHRWTDRSGFTRIAPIFLWAMQAEISVVMFWSAVGKINPRFLSGGVLAGSLRDGLVPVPAWVLQPSFLRWLGLAVIAGELFIAGGLWLPRVRRAALVLAVALHGGILLFVWPASELAAFGLVMAAGYVLFLPSGETVAS